MLEFATSKSAKCPLIASFKQPLADFPGHHENPALQVVKAGRGPPLSETTMTVVFTEEVARMFCTRIHGSSVI